MCVIVCVCCLRFSNDKQHMSYQDTHTIVFGFWWNLGWNTRFFGCGVSCLFPLVLAPNLHVRRSTAQHLFDLVQIYEDSFHFTDFPNSLQKKITRETKKNCRFKLGENKIYRLALSIDRFASNDAETQLKFSHFTKMNFCKSQSGSWAWAHF